MKPRLIQRSAFTIVELLIATAITVIIVAMLGTMFGSLMSAASRANQRTDAFRDARAALQMIQRDLSCTVAAKSTAYFAINNDTSNSSGSQARHIYALIAIKNKPLPSSAVAGDLCAAGYYCSWDPSTKSYRLLRYFKDSNTTLQTLLKPALQVNGYAAMGDLYQLNVGDEVLASDCWNLLVTPCDAAGNVMTGITYPYICDPSSTTTNPLPAAIEVSFKAMSAAAARTVIAAGAGPDVWMAYDQTASNGQDKQLYDRVIAPHVYQFRTRVMLK
jgi:type II secretory pathway pseudopilin PulG